MHWDLLDLGLVLFYFPSPQIERERIINVLPKM